MDHEGAVTLIMVRLSDGAASGNTLLRLAAQPWSVARWAPTDRLTLDQDARDRAMDVWRVTMPRSLAGDRGWLPTP